MHDGAFTDFDNLEILNTSILYIHVYIPTRGGGTDY